MEYTWFKSKEIHLRAVITSPLASTEKRLPAVLLVSALVSPQLIGVDFASPARNLAYTLSKNGFRILRFELRGYGDSEGEDYRETGFYSEVEDNAAALDYLTSRHDVDPGRVFVYGHSTGGMEAALLAGKGKAAGLIVSCTIGRTFLERMADTLRLQGKLAGRSASETDRTILDYLFFCAAVARGATQQEIIRQNSKFIRFFNSAGRIMDDRTLEFWREQLQLNLGEVYSQVKIPVLILYADSDYLTQLACHERIRDLLNEISNPDVTLLVIPETDHCYAHAKNKKAAYENSRTGKSLENQKVYRILLNWLHQHSS